MSTFEDYNTTCNGYDDNRQPLGADIVAGMMHVYNNKPLKELHLLDAGCGTGNYTKSLINYGVGKVTLMDASTGMLERAKVKLADALSRDVVVDTVEHRLPYMPFDDATFDAILFSQVLHHLDTNDDINESQRFEQLGHAIAEAGRVLCQNGTMFIMASTPDDIMNSWYNHLNMEISRKYVKKFASIHQFLDIFKRTGVTCIQKMKLLGSVLVDYDNAEGPLNKTWRDSDSYWAMANEKEIKDVEQKINALKKDGKFKDFVEKHDRVHTNGIATLFVCKKI